MGRGMIEAAAVEAMGRGWAVLPVNGKIPATPNGLHDASTEVRLAGIWFDRHPKRGLAVATGKRSGVWVLDLDGGEAIKWFADLQQEHGAVEEGVASKTSRGYHLFFRMPVSADVRNSASKISPGVDVRGTGGYVVVPPSPHPEGEAYRWMDGRGPNDIPLTEAPSWLLDIVQAPAAHNRPASQRPGIVTQGGRNVALASFAGSLRRKGASQEGLLAAIRVENESYTPPLPDDEIKGIARSVARYTPAPDHPKACHTPTGFGTEQEHLTDLGNAQRFVRLHGAQVRFVPDWGSWLMWDGKRWKRDRLGGVMRLAKETVLAMHRDALEIEDRSESKRLSDWAYRSEAEGKLLAMVSLARTGIGIPLIPEHLDAEPWLLNVENGTIDLRTGNLLPHDQDSLITKLAPVEFDPTAQAPLWDSFLGQIMSKDLVSFVRRSVGYSMVGICTEHVLLLLYGTGANGKTTFINSILELLGDYGKQSEPDLLIRKRGDAHPTGIADLKGTRFVATSEIDNGRSLAEAVVKRLTGGDMIKARYMRQNFFEFKPTHTLWLAANHKPVIRGQDAAIWRRIRLVPFNVTIPSAERDIELGAKLMAELPGILNWALEGCREWQEKGLDAPPEVRNATREYMRDSDILASFIDEYCVLGPTRSAGSSELYRKYKTWAEEAGERILSQKLFGQQLCERGLERGKHPETRLIQYRGIGLLTDSERMRNHSDVSSPESPHIATDAKTLSHPFGVTSDEAHKHTDHDANRGTSI